MELACRIVSRDSWDSEAEIDSRMSQKYYVASDGEEHDAPSSVEMGNPEQTGVDWMRILPRILLTLGIVGLITGLGIYFLKTETVEVKDVPVRIDKATRYTKLGFMSTDYYAEIQVEPTTATKPETSYLVILDNGMIKKEYKVSWEQLEIDINKAKTVTNKISQDEHTALEMQPGYNFRTFEVKPQHQMLYLLVPGIVVLVAFILLCVLPYRAPPKSVGGQKQAYATPNRAPPKSAERQKQAYATPTQQDISPDGARWEVDGGGTVRPGTNEPKVTEPEPMSYMGSEFLMPQSPFNLGETLSNLSEDELKRAKAELTEEETELVKEIKEDIREKRRERKWGRL